ACLLRRGTLMTNPFEEMKLVLAKPENWTRGFFARSSPSLLTNHNMCSAVSEKAVCWCLSGAHFRVKRTTTATSGWYFMDERTPKPFRHVAEFNDDPSTTFEGIHAFLDECSSDWEASNG
ncbi:hypothetical protein N9K16_06295, partial [Alphaproteobacteria bacterium]|nr:hypothetical protein [Alphaproteobacteria bacterium]